MTPSSTQFFGNVCFGAGLYIATDTNAVGIYKAATAVGLASAALTPIDGLSGNCNACAFVNGLFYVFDTAGNVATSPDGAVWTVASLNFPAPDTVIDAILDSTNNSLIAFSHSGYISTLAQGAPAVVTPNIVGDTLTTAISVLTGVGLVIGTVTLQASNTVPVSDIISQTPPAGTNVPPGTAINLVISTGPASIIRKLTKKLLLSLHRPFDKDPHPQLAFRIQYDGTGLTWSILNGVLSLTATGGTGVSYTFNIANFKIGQLAQFIAALPGYSIPYQDTSAYALLSALALLDSSGSINVSNGDHVFGYTTLLWAWMDANSSELGAAKAQIDNALLQMNTIDAQDEWLDYHGTFYNVPRQQAELDPGYSPRMIASVLQPRGNNIAIAEAIKSITQAGQNVFVIDAINDIGFAITYNGLIHFDGAEFYDAGLGVNGAYGFFDVDFSFDFAGPVTQSTYYAQILTTVEDFRDGGTQLRAVIFRNNGSTTTVISDTFVGRIRVIVYDDFTGSTYRLLEDGSTRFNEDGSARILET